MISDSGILYIEPSGDVSEEPVLDELTLLMASALRTAPTQGILGEDGVFYPGVAARGYHICNCGVRSSNCDYQLINGTVTNSLAVHYLAFHRHEIDAGQLEKVQTLSKWVAPVNPTEDELQSPHR